MADDTSLFTIVKVKNVSSNILNKDLSLIFKWVYDWEMLFNPDHKKPAKISVIFKKKVGTNSPDVYNEQHSS